MSDDLGAHGHLDVADGAARPRRGVLGARRPGAASSRAAKPVRTGAIARTREQQRRSWPRSRSMRASIVKESVGSLTPAPSARSRSCCRARQRELELGQVGPDQRELAEQRSKKWRAERPVDVGQAAFLARRRSDAAEQQLDRAEHEARSRRSAASACRSARRRRSRPIEFDGTAPCALDHVSWVEVMTSSSSDTRSSADRRVEAVRQKVSSARFIRRSWSAVNFVGRVKFIVRRRGGAAGRRRARRGDRSAQLCRAEHDVMDNASGAGVWHGPWFPSGTGRFAVLAGPGSMRHVRRPGCGLSVQRLEDAGLCCPARTSSRRSSPATAAMWR